MRIKMFRIKSNADQYYYHKVIKFENTFKD